MKIDTRIGTLECTHDFANGFPMDEQRLIRQSGGREALPDGQRR